MQLLISCAIAFMVTLGLISVLRPLALRIDWVDLPGGRKTHAGAVPLIGGVAMFGGFCTAALFLPISLAAQRVLFVTAGLLVLAGVLDDFNELAAKMKGLLQLIAAALVVFLGGVVLHNLGNLLFLADIRLPLWLAQLITLIAIVGILNAVNMSDGLDGLAGSLTLIELIFLLYLAGKQGWSEPFHLLALTIAVVLAFLCVNFPWSKKRTAIVFMGDAGALFLGLILVWHLISLSQAPINAAAPVTFLWIMAVPVFDTADAILRRWSSRVSPMRSDRYHIHHVLKQLGFTDRSIVIMLAAAAALMGLIGILADHYQVSSSIMFIVFCVLFVGYAQMSRHLRLSFKARA